MTADPNAPVTLGSHPEFAKWDAEVQGHFKNAGWDQKQPHEVAFEALKSWKEAERLIGGPKEQLLRLPKDATDSDGWKAVWQRLGAGAKVEDYDFKDLKRADGSAADDKFTTALRTTFHAEGIPKDKALSIARSVVKVMDDVDGVAATERTANLVKEKDALAKNWGANMESNRFIVKQAVARLGLTEEVVGSIEKAAGYEKTMEALLKIGVMMGEDKFISNPNNPDVNVRTSDQAAARMAELKQDQAWVTKLNKGDAAAVREFNALTELMSRRAA